MLKGWYFTSVADVACGRVNFCFQYSPFWPRAFSGAAEDPLPPDMEAIDTRELTLSRNSSQQMIDWWGGVVYKYPRSVISQVG